MIRLIKQEDAESIWALVESNRDYLRRWLPWLDYTQSISDTEKFIEDAIAGYANKKCMVNVIEDEEIVGIVGFNSFNWDIKAGYIGYWVSESMRGKGITGSFCKELQRIGFEEHDLNKIEIHVAVENIASRRVAEKLGYVETGTLLDAEWLYDHYVDHIVLI